MNIMLMTLQERFIYFYCCIYFTLMCGRLYTFVDIIVVVVVVVKIYYRH